jgi:hypothetical protein
MEFISNQSSTSKLADAGKICSETMPGPTVNETAW